MLSVERLAVNSDIGRAILDPISFEVARGQLCVLSGGHGSGKTLYARAICGLLPSSLEISGKVRCEEAVYVGEDADSQIATLSVLDEVASSLEYSLMPPTEVEERCQWALQTMGLEGLETRNPWTLSGGQRQRLALATAIARRPSTLVLDNPCSNVDKGGRALVYSVLRELADDGTTIVLCESRDSKPKWANVLVPLPKRNNSGDKPLDKSGDIEQSFLFEDAASAVNVPSISFCDITCGTNPVRLDPFSIDLLPGKTYVLTGPNGCGKTTFMALMAGAVKPTGGTIMMNGSSVRRLPDGILSWAQQNPERQFVFNSVEEEINDAFKKRDTRGPLSEQDLVALPQWFGLTEFYAKSPYSLSGSQKELWEFCYVCY